MTKPSPLLGYNTNVRHKGKVYHIQTEDSGIAHPHIITHLFADGGRIVASRKTSYAEHVGTPEYPNGVKKMMQEQHKAMFIALRDGHFDESEAMFGQGAAGKAAGANAATAAAAAAATTEPQAPKPTTSATILDASKPAAAPPAPEQRRRVSQHPARASKHPPAPPPKRPSLQGTAAGGTPAMGVKSVPTPRSPDVDALEKAAAARERESLVSAAPPPSPSRYQTTQPTRSIARAKRPSAPPEPPASIFGSDLLSEKSLDEVILSYLAEDLEEK